MRRLPGPAGCRLGEGVPAPEALSNCFGTGREHKLNLLCRPFGALDSKWMSVCLAKTLRVRRINDFAANLRCALFAMIT
jgi:hypothetical protein